VLLDTHTFLWFVTNDPRLTPPARTAIENPDTQAFLSIASAWEMSIKVSIGKLPLAQPFEEFLPAQLLSNRIDLLPITPKHLYRTIALPFHHKDPFDRLIAAQSLVEGMPLVSGDTAFDAYSVDRLW
jgi:PIN domain nuclease of toxin-antitoxin system